MKVLFICTGNTCRSPMAMGLFRDMLYKEGLHDVIVESAGISAFEGLPASEYAIEALREINIDISSHHSKNVTSELLKDSDLIVCISPYHISSVISMIPELKSKTILLGNGIDDPYGMSLDTYIETRDQIKKALDDLLQVVKKWLG